MVSGWHWLKGTQTTAMVWATQGYALTAKSWDGACDGRKRPCLVQESETAGFVLNLPDAVVKGAT